MVSSRIGGPELGTMQIEVHKGDLEDLQHLGLEFSCKNPLLTKPVRITYESDDAAYVLFGYTHTLPSDNPKDESWSVTEPRVIRLDKKMMGSVIVTGTDESTNKKCPAALKIEGPNTK